MIGVPLGVLSAVKRDSKHDYAARVGGLIGVSIPSFWLATLLLLFTSRVFGWVPPLNYVPFYEDPIENLSQFILPAISISVFTLAIVMRMVRATMLEVLGQDYVRTARAKGVKRKVVISRHALRNALIPVVTVVGFEIGILMGGSAIVEIIFGLPGPRQHADQRDLQPRLPGRPGRDDAARVHLHLCQPARRSPLRRARPEDLPGMSNFGNNEAPILGAEGRSSEVGIDAWVYAPTRTAGKFAKWRNPIGIAGAIIVGLNVFIALFGPYIWTIDPDELVATPPPGAELGASDGNRRARSGHARPHHPRRAGVAAGRDHLRLDRLRPRRRASACSPASSAAGSTAP